MGRPLRKGLAGQILHVLNRANGRARIFHRDGDFSAFEKVVEEACDRVPIRILAYCVMPNHWHFVVWPRRDHDLSRFIGWMTLTHTQRWHAHHRTAGSGHLYQGRFKSFVVRPDGHLLRVLRYVERNPLRAGLVERAEDWRWSSLWRREFGGSRAAHFLSDWPVPRPSDWVELVHGPQAAGELKSLRQSVNRNRPYGDPEWAEKTARSLGLESTLRPRGRPRRAKLTSRKGS